jgi:hypothetical protein
MVLVTRIALWVAAVGSTLPSLAQPTGVLGLHIGARFAATRGMATGVRHHTTATGDLVSVLNLNLPGGGTDWRGVRFNVAQAWFEDDTLMAVHLQLTQGPNLEAAYQRLRTSLGGLQSTTEDAGVQETVHRTDGLLIQLIAYRNSALELDEELAAMEQQMSGEHLMEDSAQGVATAGGSALPYRHADSLGAVHVMVWHPVRYLRTLAVGLECPNPMLSPRGLQGVWKVQDVQGMFAEIGRFAQFQFDNGVMHFVSADRLRREDFRYTLNGSQIRLQSLNGPHFMEFCATLNRDGTLVLENPNESLRYLLER